VAAGMFAGAEWKALKSWLREEHDRAVHVCVTSDGDIRRHQGKVMVLKTLLDEDQLGEIIQARLTGDK